MTFSLYDLTLSFLFCWYVHLKVLNDFFYMNYSVRPSVRLYYCVRSINPIPIEGFSSNMAEMGMCKTHVAHVSAQGQGHTWRSNIKQSNIRHYVVSALYIVSPTLIERFSLTLAQMFTLTRECAEPMLPISQLKIKVTLEGQKLT